MLGLLYTIYTFHQYFNATMNLNTLITLALIILFLEVFNYFQKNILNIYFL
jgi:hypothetical protein